MLADETIQPAFQLARQTETGRIDGEHQRVVEDRTVEPVRHDEINAVGIAVCIGPLGPFDDP